MAYQFKSKTLQAIQAKQEQQAKETVSLIAQQFARVRQSTEELTGERGSNRAVRQTDIAPAKTYKLKSAKFGMFGGDVDAAAYNRLVDDVHAIYALLAKIAGE